MEATKPRSIVKQKPLAVRLLAGLARLLPSDDVRTAVYLRLVAPLRKALKQFVFGFYRIDHIYEVLRRARRSYKGEFSILEFGTAHGYAFTKMLYAARFLKMDRRVKVHGFDTFEGMPPAENEKDEDQISNDGWVEGQFAGGYEELDTYCRTRYANYELHQGNFNDSVTPAFLESLKQWKPVLIWIDCDYYSSTVTVMERVLPYIPNGCVIYFDDFELLNFGSRFTGEARFVAELNAGEFGDDVELILDPALSLDSKRVYRFFRFNSEVQYERVSPGLSADSVRKRGNDSPLP